MDKIIDTMSVSEKEILRQFKKNVSDILTPRHTDSILYKFLKVKNYDLRNAERNFRQVVVGWKFYGIDTFPKSYVKNEIMEKYEATNNMGFAKDGTVIRYENVGRLDIIGLIMSEPCFQFVTYLCCCFEIDLAMLREKSLQEGREINEVTYIFDMEGWSFKQIAHKSVIEMTMDCVSTVQDCYPNIFRKLIIINAPFGFDKIFNLFRPVMRTNFLERVEIIPSDSTGEILLQYIDEDVLPVSLGGKRVDSKGDPKCSEFMKYGGIVPEECYFRNRIRMLMPSDPDITMVEIARGSVYNHSVVAKEARGTLHFEYRTENGSINCGVFYRKFGSNSWHPDIPSSDELLDESDEKSNVFLLGSTFTTPTHLTPNIVFGKILSPGIYIIRFDNRRSWFTSRKLFLRAYLKPPQQYIIPDSSLEMKNVEYIAE